MVVEDFGGTHEVNGDAQIETLLATRYGDGLNEFWIFRGSHLHPSIAIQANGDLACIHYFPRDGHAGFLSIGPAPSLNPRGRTIFATTTPTETSSIPNHSVVSFSWALAVAKEFARSKKLPHCIEWLEL